MIEMTTAPIRPEELRQALFDPAAGARRLTGHQANLHVRRTRSHMDRKYAKLFAGAASLALAATSIGVATAVAQDDAEAPPEADYEVVLDQATLDRWLKQLADAERFTAAIAAGDRVTPDLGGEGSTDSFADAIIARI